MDDPNGTPAAVMLHNQKEFLEDQVSTLLREKKIIASRIEELSSKLDAVEADCEFYYYAACVQKERADKLAAILRLHGIEFDD